MKLLRVGEPSNERPAVLLDDDRVVDVSAVLQDWNPATLERDLDSLERIGYNGLPEIDMATTRIGPPVSTPQKVVCIGLNFADHARESRQAAPEEPVVFFKAPNTVVGPYDDVLLPVDGQKTDWEVELAVVIGVRARYLPDLDAADDVIAGYCVSNDVSERSFQLERGGQWVKGKSCETFNPLGPWLVTPEDIADPQRLQMSMRVNGEQMQQGSTADMIFSVHHVVWYLSQFMVLEPGDIVNTGTPAGVGMGHTPPRYLRDGDVMEARIQGLGSQRQRCRLAVKAAGTFA